MFRSAGFIAVGFFLLWGIVTLLRAEDHKPIAPVLTSADREPAHLAYGQLVSAQARFAEAQLVVQYLPKVIEQLKAAHDAELQKLVVKCKGNLVADENGLGQCGPVQATKVEAKKEDKPK